MRLAILRSALDNISLPSNTTINVSGLIVSLKNGGSDWHPVSGDSDTTNPVEYEPPPDSSLPGETEQDDTIPPAGSYFTVEVDPRIISSNGSGLTFDLPLGWVETMLSGPAVSITAQLPGGSPLPSWIQFDPATSVFAVIGPDGTIAVVESYSDEVVTVSLPPNADGGVGTGESGTRQIVIEVLLRDAAGNVAVVRLLVTVSANASDLQIDVPGARHAEMFDGSGDVVIDARRMLAMLGIQTSGHDLGAHDAAAEDADGFARATDRATHSNAMGRAGLTEQMRGFGWRAISAERTTLLKALPQNYTRAY